MNIYLVGILTLAAIGAISYMHYTTRKNKIKPSLMLTIGFIFTVAIIGAVLYLSTNF